MDRIGERSLPALLDERALQHDDRAFLVHEDLEGRVTTLSFAETRRQTRRFGAALQRVGLVKGDRAFVFLRNTTDFVPMWFGILTVGGVFVPGNIHLTAPEVAYLIATAEPKVVVTEARFLPLMRQVLADRKSEIPLLSVDGGDGGLDLRSLVQGLSEPDPVALASGDLAEIIFTSGTSSRPKGVMLTHANLVWCAMAGVATTGLSTLDRSFNNKPLFHVNCQETVLSCLDAGATAVIGERYSASRYVSQLIRHKATICSLSGMLCRTLLNQPPGPDDRRHSIRFAGYGINISEAEMSAFVERFGIRIRNGYGQSEAMVYISAESLASPSTYPSIGLPVLEREIFIVDEAGEPVPDGTVGEIVVRGRPGRNLMLGYFRDEEATKAAFRGGVLHTNDLGSIDAAGNLHFHGRRGDMIKRAGENISIREVEDVLVSHDAVLDVAVIGVPDPIRDQAVKAFVVLRDGQSIPVDDLKAFCRSRLAYYKVPEFITVLPRLPRNASGKIVRRDLERISKPEDLVAGR